jgi:hypothetical protein
MTRQEGIEMVKKYDHIKSSDTFHWLDYVGITEEEFDSAANKFRSEKVWKVNAKGIWEKRNIWD